MVRFSWKGEKVVLLIGDVSESKFFGSPQPFLYETGFLTLAYGPFFVVTDGTEVI